MDDVDVVYVRLGDPDCLAMFYFSDGGVISIPYCNFDSVLALIIRALSEYNYVIYVERPLVVAYSEDSLFSPDFSLHLSLMVRESLRFSGFKIVEVPGPIYDFDGASELLRKAWRAVKDSLRWNRLKLRFETEEDLEAFLQKRGRDLLEMKRLTDAITVAASGHCYLVLIPFYVRVGDSRDLSRLSAPLKSESKSKKISEALMATPIGEFADRSAVLAALYSVFDLLDTELMLEVKYVLTFFRVFSDFLGDRGVIKKPVLTVFGDAFKDFQIPLPKYDLEREEYLMTVYLPLLLDLRGVDEREAALLTKKITGASVKEYKALRIAVKKAFKLPYVKMSKPVIHF